MAEYNQRRGMGYKYSQDPAQQDWQEELKLKYAGLPAQRALTAQQEQFEKSLQLQKDNAATQQSQFAQSLAEQQRNATLNYQTQQKAMENQETASKYALGGNILAALPAAYGYGTQQGWWGSDPNAEQKKNYQLQNAYLQQQMYGRMDDNTTRSDPAYNGKAYQQNSYFDGPRQIPYQSPGGYYGQATPRNYASGMNYDAPSLASNHWDGGYAQDPYVASPYPAPQNNGGGGFWDNFGFGDGGLTFSF